MLGPRRRESLPIHVLVGNLQAQPCKGCSVVNYVPGAHWSMRRKRRPFSQRHPIAKGLWSARRGPRGRSRCGTKRKALWCHNAERARSRWAFPLKAVRRSRFARVRTTSSWRHRRRRSRPSRCCCKVVSGRGGRRRRFRAAEKTGVWVPLNKVTKKWGRCGPVETGVIRGSALHQFFAPPNFVVPRKKYLPPPKNVLPPKH